MKLYFMAVVLAPPSGKSVILAQSKDLSSFSFFQRPSVAEFMTFTSTTLAERTQPNERKRIGNEDTPQEDTPQEDTPQEDTLQEDTPQGSKQGVNYVFYVHKGSVPEHLAAVVITDQDYPSRPAFSLLKKLLDEFTAKVPVSSFSDPASIDFPDITTYITKYQDARQADTIMRVQQELNETKIVLHKTIESVLQRGEKLDDLVDRSNALSLQSKVFYKTAKKQNSCCIIM